MSAPTSTPPQPGLGQPGEQCLHCGAELAPDQRYCLNCGLRRTGPRVEYRELLLGQRGGPSDLVPAPPAEVASPAPAPPGPPGESRAISPLGAAVAIGLLLLATLLGAVIGRGGGDSGQQPVVVGGAPAAAAAAGAVTSDWKAGDAWTVQIQAFPKDSTTPEQVQQAKSAAQAKGAPDVGVLVSDDYPSLAAGQYILYSGNYPAKAGAEKALAGLTANFPDASVIQVSKTAAAAEAGAAAGAAKEKSSGGSGGGSSSPPADVQNLENSTSTKDYVNKSKKLPDKVGTGGAAPPTDNKAPGGDSGGGETIG